MKYPNSAKDSAGSSALRRRHRRHRTTFSTARARLSTRARTCSCSTARTAILRTSCALSRLVKEKYPDIQLVAGNVATRRGARKRSSRRARTASRSASAPAPSAPPALWPASACRRSPRYLSAAERADKFGVPGHCRRRHQVLRRHRQGHRRGRQRRDDGQHARRLRGSARRDRGIPGHVSSRSTAAWAASAPCRCGSKDRYFQQNNKKLVPEGVEGRVPYKGPAERHHLSDDGRPALRHGLHRLPHNIEELRTNSKFVRITSAGLKESHPHDIYITKEAPNYTMNP